MFFYLHYKDAPESPLIEVSVTIVCPVSQQQVAQLLEEPPEVLVEHYGIEGITRRTCSPEGDASSKAESRHWLLELTRIVRLQIASSIQESAHEFLIDDLIILDTQQADDPGGSLGYQFMTGKAEERNSSGNNQIDEDKEQLSQSNASKHLHTLGSHDLELVEEETVAEVMCILINSGEIDKESGRRMLKV